MLAAEARVISERRRGVSHAPGTEAQDTRPTSVTQRVARMRIKLVEVIEDLLDPLQARARSGAVNGGTGARERRTMSGPVTPAMNARSGKVPEAEECETDRDQW